jgi:hypothetical protein
MILGSHGIGIVFLRTQVGWLIFWHNSMGVAAIHCDFETANGVSGILRLDYSGSRGR